MKFDVFLSICQTEVDGFKPSEKQMFQNFFDQVQLADELGFGTAWVAETHLSCQVQKETSYAVIPHFKGEIGLNTDILQLAHRIFANTKKINVGSAIRNILCNGGPIAHAEAIKTFLSLHALNPNESRKLNIGFASGRFEFSNRPYGIRPRNKTEELAWAVVKGKILHEATEIFLRFLKGDVFSSADVTQQFLTAEDFREPRLWSETLNLYADEFQVDKIEVAKLNAIPVNPFFNFEKSGVIPFESPLDLLELTLGSHDQSLQEKANEFLPVGVFNLSITPPEVIEKTHERMNRLYHKSGGVWKRELMPRTAMIFVDDSVGLSAEEKTKKAQEVARRAWKNYWLAMEGTIDNEKVEKAVDNTLAGSPEQLINLINAKYHPEDKLMLWFDFNNHDNETVKTENAGVYGENSS